MARPKVIIHLDINGTIMPADPIKSKHVKSMLNIHLSKQAFVKRTVDQDGDNSEIVWWNGTPFNKGDKPPLLPQFRYTCHIREHYQENLSDSDPDDAYTLPGSISLEDFNAVWGGGHCDKFTSRNLPGHVYEPELINLMDALAWRHDDLPAEVVEALTLPCPDGRRMNLFVPAFLRLLESLHAHRTEQEFAIVIRTFGSDIPRLLPAFSLIARGLHPDLPIAGCIQQPEAFGSLKRSRRGEFVMRLTRADSSETRVNGNEAILKYLDSLSCGAVVLINDDYDTWRDNDFNPVFGKPIFVDLNNLNSVRHVLFDDNVNLDPTDSIAAVWLKQDSHAAPGEFTSLPLSSKAGLAMIGTALLQASLYVSIMNPMAFVSELDRALRRYDTLIDRLRAIKPIPYT